MASLGALATNPESVVQATVETISWGIDVTASLPTGQTPSAPSSKLVNFDTGAVVTSPSSSVSGNVISQTIPGGSLTAGQTYLLTVTYTAGSDTLANVLTIVCPV